MLDHYLIEHCSPTLANLKTANLFRCSFCEPEELRRNLAQWNRVFTPKGISLMVLRLRQQEALVYVYRKNRLAEDLAKAGVASFLRCCGYQSIEPEGALSVLQQKLHTEKAFPHEIGLFLGYPLEDVKGFIQNEGKNSKHSGCWKVYCNEHNTIELFEKFQKCHRIYRRLFQSGRTVSQLTVAV